MLTKLFRRTGLADMPHEIEDAISRAKALLKRNGVRIPADVQFGYYFNSYAWHTAPDDDGKIRIGLKAWLSDYKHPDGLLEVVLHEYGHVWLFQNWQHFTKAQKQKFRRLFGPINHEPKWWEWLRPPEQGPQHVTRYAAMSPHEDWAETFYHLFFEDVVWPTKQVEKKADWAWEMICEIEGSV